MASDTEQNKIARKPSAFLYLAAASALLGAIGMQTIRENSEKSFTNQIIH
jgi:hypothetical protein